MGKVTKKPIAGQLSAGGSGSRPYGFYRNRTYNAAPTNSNETMVSGEGTGDKTKRVRDGREAKRSFAESFFAYFFHEKSRRAARRDTRSHRAGIQKRRAAGPGRSGSGAVGTAWSVWQPGGAPGGRPPSLSACHPMRRVPVWSRPTLESEESSWSRSPPPSSRPTL